MFGFYTLQHVPASKRTESDRFEVLEAITLYCTVFELITGNFKAIWSCRIIDRFTLTVKLIWIIGDLHIQRSCKGSYTVIIFPTRSVTT